MSIPDWRTFGRLFIVLGRGWSNPESNSSWYGGRAETMQGIPGNDRKYELRSSTFESQQTIACTMNIPKKLANNF
jgi:hypothetical protein